jgi:FkbM family methyltransferase
MAGVARSLALSYGIPFRARHLVRLYSPFVAPGGLAFDVGAHAGNRVRAFRSLGARVVAVEPQPDFVRLLEALYGGDHSVTIVPAAVGRAIGAATLLASERTPTVTTLSAGWATRVGADASFRGVRWTPGARVPVTTLDALIAAHGRPDFVKLDVEGYEAEALVGLSTPVAALSFEYLAAARDVALDCIDRLGALGRYAYNWSAGERQRLAERAWLEPDAIRAWLRTLPADAGSGDIYARLLA